MNFIKKLGICVSMGWHLLKVFWQIISGLYSILDLTHPCVSIFGGSRLKQDSSYAQDAYAIAAKLVSNGISVLTGGGPGIMQAGNCGANSVKHTENDIVTMGIGVSGLGHEQAMNPCAKKTMMFDYFFARKWLLLNYSVGYIIFPGGFGTMDELSELLNEMQTGKIRQAPVILIGTNYWKPYQAWVNEARKHHLLSETHEPKITITDDLDYAVSILVKHCESCETTGINSKKS